MNKTILFLLLSCTVLYSCMKEPLVEDIMKQSAAETPKTRSSGTEYETMPNPYALDVMQEVYDAYDGSTILEPTDLYVRFLPQDSTQFRILHYDYGLELFDYPLDVVLEEGETYVDPTIQEGDFSWLYTTVKPDFEFPAGIQYEILEECYIPEEGESIDMTKGNPIDVENAAFERLGYAIEDSPDTKGASVPQGTIRVYDDFAGNLVPVKGVKIRCHTIVKWGTGFTDENGNYTIDKKFLIGPHYAIVFENNKDFDIWGQYGPLAKANHNMGWHRKTGHSEDIYTNSDAWKWAAVNNAAYEYYQMCEQTGITKPPAGLKIWVFKDWGASSAPMLRRIKDFIGYNGNIDPLNFFINAGYGIHATNIVKYLKFLLPDITIGTSEANYKTVYYRVNHELSHASHCSTVGSEFWAKYVSYIMTYGAYGNGNGKNAELCGIGDMWGYSMGHLQEHNKYEDGIDEDYPYTIPDGAWIKPGIFWELFRHNTLTPKQIYDCLIPEVETYEALVKELYRLYPAKADLIEQAFIDYGITPNVNKPGSGITYDTFFSNRAVTSSVSVMGNDILVQNVTVSNGATLTITGTNSVTLDKPFNLEKGCTLEILRDN